MGHDTDSYIGSQKELGRAIRLVEDDDPAIQPYLHTLRERPREAYVIGLTGPPGSGKSTITDQLIACWRERGKTVGILAVDPSSPFSGGAVLGDRIRMQRHAIDEGVFIRSLAARGHLGGLAPAVRDAIRLIDASGRERCLLETVGVGQSELEVMECADTTVVVLTPVSGDSIQAIKAGILEIADIFVVNKSDIQGVERVTRELRELLRQTQSRRDDGWKIPVIQTEARSGKGIAELLDAIEQHYTVMVGGSELGKRRKRQREAEIEAIVIEQATLAVQRAFNVGNPLIEAELHDPYEVADAILVDAFSKRKGERYA